MNRKLKERVQQLEEILLGIQEESTDPKINNRLDKAIDFMQTMAEEVSKTQTFLENLLKELRDNNIISETKASHLKMISDLEFEVQHLKSRLADVIRRENELEHHEEIPEALKENTRKAKESLCQRIKELEVQLEDMRSYERSHTENSVCSDSILPPNVSPEGDQA